MAYLIGIVLAAIVCAFATIVGLDRDRAFYPTLTIVIASYYGLFAVMGGLPGALLHESIPILVFLALAVLGFKWSPWLLVVAMAAHGVFDLLHGRLIANPGVPMYWPAFCLSYDVVTALYLAVLLLLPRRRQSSNPDTAHDLHRDQAQVRAHEQHVR
jgi:hypothetical protein